LLLVDVDGVVSLFGFAHLPPAGLLPTVVECVPHLLSAHAGPLLARLSDSFECVWAPAGRSGRRSTCRGSWAAERTAPTLLVRTDPATGLPAEHVSVLERWARRL